MKKMAFLLAMILVVALTVVPASASGSAAGGGGASSGAAGGTTSTPVVDTTTVPTVNADKSGKFALEETGLTAGEWYGMLVLKSGIAPSATLSSSDILYIDQVKADTNGTIAFEGFGLLGGATEGDVFIGGKGLEDGAKNIATLAAYQAPVLTGITLDKNAATAKKGETVALTATFVPAGAEGTLTWVSSDATVAKVAADTADQTKATVTVSGEAAKDATATITVFVDADADGAYTSADTIAASCVITVVEAPAYKLGDVTEDGVVDVFDGQRLYEHLTEANLLTEGTPAYLAADVTEDGVVDVFDGQRLYEHLTETNPLPENN